MAVTGNKGEWSELYTFLRLLADGKLYAADGHLNKIDSIYFPIIKIIREETIGKRKDYFTGSEITISIDGNEIKIPAHYFSEEAEHLLKQIKSVSGHSFSSEKTEKFMNIISVECLEDKSRDKADIIVQIHDIQTGFSPEVGFSIKSKLGKPATLFNASKASNFTYEIIGDKDKLNFIAANLEKIQGVEIPNSINKSNGIKQIIQEIENLGCDLSYNDVDDRFCSNLMMSDSQMPIIVAELLIAYYSGQSKARVESALEKVILKNPLSVNSDKASIFYIHKIKSLLCDMALGMVATLEWYGTDEASGGYIVVKEDGEIVAYHILKRDLFKDYLFLNAKFEAPQRFDSLPPSKKKGFDYGYIYEKDSKLFIKLNLQIRFI